MSGEPFYPARLFRYAAVHMRLLASPTFIVECEDHLRAKLDAIAAYESQFSANPANAGLIERLEAAARMWGSFAGVGAGEPFFSAEPIGICSPDEIL
jgi:LmbE family N-acetylglucosaminyl deacetylase